MPSYSFSRNCFFCMVNDDMVCTIFPVSEINIVFPGLAIRLFQKPKTVYAHRVA